MSASLVGSEMCIRDSPLGWGSGRRPPPSGASRAGTPRRAPRCARPAASRAVSYTHLTLPTICSV
eukprot:8025646-Alexandrium_andersonii.AAC.1